MTLPLRHKMNWWCELPKLDLTTALQIKGASGELLQLKGQGFSWVKPSAAQASIFSLATPHSGKGGLDVIDATDTGIKLNRPTTTRGWISWAVNWPAGSRIVFDWSTTPSIRVQCGLDDALGLASFNHTILNAVGSGSVDYIIPAGGGWSYFGFNIATGLVTITNFAVYAP